MGSALAPTDVRPYPRRTYEPRTWHDVGLTRTWRLRGFALHLGGEYIRKRYVGTWLGFLWIPLRPGIDLLTRALVFGGFLGVAPGDRPYFVYLVVGSAGWFFFDQVVLWSYRGLQYHRRYFQSLELPWLASVAGSVLPGALEAVLYAVIGGVAAVVYLVLDGTTHFSLHAGTPIALAGLGVLALYGWMVGCFLAPLVNHVRDVRLLLKYALGFVYFVTPVLYPIDAIPENYRAIIESNPLTAPVAWIQNAFLETPMPPGHSTIISLVGIVILLPLGLLSLAKVERASHARI